MVPKAINIMTRNNGHQFHFFVHCCAKGCILDKTIIIHHFFYLFFFFVLFFFIGAFYVFHWYQYLYYVVNYSHNIPICA